MAWRSCSGLLMSVLIISFALEHSYASSYEGNVGTMRMWLRGSRASKVLSHHNHAFHGTVAAVANARKVLGGTRNMLQEVDEHQHSPKAATPATSGCENVITKHSARKIDESKALADEVANLMSKDYSFRGQDRPRRKPPINNNQPKD